MALNNDFGWTFYPARPAQANVDGNIAKLFNTGDSMPPAFFNSLVDNQNEDAVSAVIYGREGIANCLDASPASQNGSGRLGLTFEFMEYDAAESTRIWRELDLDTLARRSNSISVDRQKQLGLREADCLTRGNTAPLSVLTVIEKQGGGMPGGLDDPDSVLLRALMNVGEAQTRVGAAGSYGFGKAAVAQASRIRVVFVYTCTPKSESKDGVTRRLLGVTYWGTHRHDGVKYPGWGVFGLSVNGEVRALEDEEADAQAERMNIPIRNPEIEDDRGTTFVIIDPSFAAKQLQGAIQAFWWPLLLNTREFGLDINLVNESGQELNVDSDQNHELLGPLVKSFLEAEHCRTFGDGVVEESRVIQLGTAGITALQVKNVDSPIRGSLIAQMRSPLMVVSYEKVRNANPEVVGVFTAHDSSNENLRRVEPAEHDKWHSKKFAGLIASADDIRISKKVREDRELAVNALRAPEPKPVYGLSAFSNHFPAIDSKAAGPRPPLPRGKPKKQRLVHVHLVHQVGDEDQVVRPERIDEKEGMLRAKAIVKFYLDAERAKLVKREFLDATVVIGAKIEEDGSSSEWYPAVVNQKVFDNETEFVQVSEPGQLPAKFEGRFKVGRNVYFEVLSDPYQSDWTMDLTFDCSPWDVALPLNINQEED